MNFKLNAWTLLFALAGAILLFCCSKGNNDCIPTRPCDKIPDYRIPADEAAVCLADYQAYLKGEINVVNPDVRYFLLPRCELAEMLKDIGPAANVKAHLAVKKLKQRNGKSENSIVLIFEDHMPEENRGQFNSEGFFDFTTPCPNLCDDQ